jgi:predicted nuclease of predicted toxin-antitoxin system
LKLLIDMNLSPRSVELLTQAGFDAVHWVSQGQMDATDVEIMQHAATNDLIVLTQDLDFGAILAASRGNKPSVVQIRADDTNSDRIGADVIRALRQAADDLARGALVTVEPGRQRLTLLPLRPP